MPLSERRSQEALRAKRPGVGIAPGSPWIVSIEGVTSIPGLTSNPPTRSGRSQTRRPSPVTTGRSLSVSLITASR